MNQTINLPLLLVTNIVRAFRRGFNVINARPALKWSLIVAAPFLTYFTLVSLVWGGVYLTENGMILARYFWVPTFIVVNVSILLVQTVLCARVVFKRGFDLKAIATKAVAAGAFVVTFALFNSVFELERLAAPIFDRLVYLISR